MPAEIQLTETNGKSRAAQLKVALSDLGRSVTQSDASVGDSADPVEVQRSIRYLPRGGTGHSPGSKRNHKIIQAGRDFHSSHEPESFLPEERQTTKKTTPRKLNFEHPPPTFGSFYGTQFLTQRSATIDSTSHNTINKMASAHAMTFEDLNDSEMPVSPSRASYSENTMNQIRDKYDMDEDIDSFDENMANIVRYETAEFDKPTPWYIVLPESTFRQTWDLLMGILVFYILIFLPLRFAFDDRIKAEQKDRHDVLNVVDMVVDILFLVDIGIMFISAYEHNGTLHTDMRSISRKYVRSGWFFIDCIAAFPFSFFTLAFSKSYIADVSKSTKLVRIFKLLRALKLVRLFRLKESFENLEYNPNIHAGMLRGCSLAFLLIMFGHFMGCIWYWIGFETRDHEEGSWFDVASMDPEDVGLFEAWIYSFYWALTSLTTIGYGDIHPMNSSEMCFAIFIMLIGTLFFSFITGTFASFLQHSDELVQEYREKMGKLMNHMAKHKVPPEIRKRVQDTMSKKWKSEQGVKNVRHNMAEIYQDIPLRILADLSHHVFRELLEKTDVLRDFKSKNRFVAQLCRSLKRKVLACNEFVILKGESPSDFFMCVKGSFMMVDRHRRLDRLDDGSIFGHVAILYDIEQPWSIISIAISTINFISGRDLLQILSMQPQFCEALLEHAGCRYNAQLASNNVSGDDVDGANVDENSENAQVRLPNTSEDDHRPPLRSQTEEGDLLTRRETPSNNTTFTPQPPDSESILNMYRKSHGRETSVLQRRASEEEEQMSRKLDDLMDLMIEYSTRQNKLERHLGIFHQPRTPPTTSNFHRDRARARSDHPLSTRELRRRPVGRTSNDLAMTRSQSEFVIPKKAPNQPRRTASSQVVPRKNNWGGEGFHSEDFSNSEKQLEPTSFSDAFEASSDPAAETIVTQVRAGTEKLPDIQETYLTE